MTVSLFATQQGTEPMASDTPHRAAPVRRRRCQQCVIWWLCEMHEYVCEWAKREEGS